MRTLILNADFTPLMVRSWQRAFNLIYSDKADAIDFYDKKIMDSHHRYHPIPAVLRVRKYIKRPYKLTIGKKKVYIRDNYTCGYCGRQLPPSKLTWDHIIPTSKYKGNSTNWKNVITCCSPCNSKKGDKLLSECNMILLWEPTIPTHLSLGLASLKTIPKEWQLYINDSKKETKSK